MQDYHEQPSTPELARYVECVWGLDSKAGIADYAVTPDGCLDVIYDRWNGLQAVGAMTSVRRFQIVPGTRIFGVRIRPGMARMFLGKDLASLTDRSIALEDLWGNRARELRRRLDDCGPIQQAGRTLLDSLTPTSITPNPVQCAIEALVLAQGAADLDVIAGHASLSPRQFRRRCMEETGLRPKLLARVLRFRHAAQLASRTRMPDWCSIAADSGYFDQSHLIRDFRSFTGATPQTLTTPFSD